MNHSATTLRGFSSYLLVWCALIASIILSFAAHHWVRPDAEPWLVIPTIGFLILGGILAAVALSPLGLPKLTAYIGMGVIGGPYVLDLVKVTASNQLSIVNSLALSLIALAGGLELEFAVVRRLLKSIVLANLVQSAVVTLLTAGAFVVMARYLPFARGLKGLSLAAVALVWGVLASSRSPSATLAVLSETNGSGPLSRWSLAFILSSDVMVVVLTTVVLVLVRPILAEESLSTAELVKLGRELLGSFSMGFILGIVLAVYLRLVGQQLLLILILLGLVMTDALNYVHFEPLLTFLVAGFTVRNLSRSGEQFSRAVHDASGVVFIVFFGIAGVHLDLGLLRSIWPIALCFVGVRILASSLASYMSATITGDPPVVRRWGWSSLISQAGLTFALAALVSREFPQLSVGFESLVVATIALNELLGPIVFKAVLIHTKEAQRGETPLHTMEEGTKS